MLEKFRHTESKLGTLARTSALAVLGLAASCGGNVAAVLGPTDTCAAEVKEFQFGKVAERFNGWSMSDDEIRNARDRMRNACRFLMVQPAESLHDPDPAAQWKTEFLIEDRWATTRLGEEWREG